MRDERPVRASAVIMNVDDNVGTVLNVRLVLSAIEA